MGYPFHHKTLSISRHRVFFQPVLIPTPRHPGPNMHQSLSKPGRTPGMRGGGGAHLQSTSTASDIHSRCVLEAGQGRHRVLVSLEDELQSRGQLSSTGRRHASTIRQGPRRVVPIMVPKIGRRRGQGLPWVTKIAAEFLWYPRMTAKPVRGIPLVSGASVGTGRAGDSSHRGT